MKSNAAELTLPAGLVLARTTDVFDNETVPAGFRRAHRVADAVWARLIVRSGSLTFVFEDQPDQPISVRAGQYIVIPPARPHHLELGVPATFAIEFYRPPSARTGQEGQDSTASE